MQEPEYPWRLPLRARDGSVKAWALVDEQDFERVNAHRWHLSNHGYAMRSCKAGGKRWSVLLHRDLMGLERGDPGEVDHINHDRLDNRRTNLRVVKAGRNQQNLALRVGYRGVKKDGHRWQARAKQDGKTVHLGSFHSEVMAAAAAAQWRYRHMPGAVEDPELLRMRVEKVPPRRPDRGLGPRVLAICLSAATTSLSWWQIADLYGIKYSGIRTLSDGRSYKEFQWLLSLPNPSRLESLGQ